MDPISVPAPPRSAYNQNRPVSDLLQHQLRHFHHVERKNALGIAPEVAGNIHTEAGAAAYIAAVTTALREKGLAEAAGKLKVVSRSKAKSKPAAPVTLDLAAAGKVSTRKAATTKKRSPAKSDARSLRRSR